jgi:hypothetical protein
MTLQRPGRYRILVTGRVPDTLADVISDRFGPVDLSSAGTRRTVVDLVADQAALRALLVLLWDVGHEVQLIQRRADSDDPSDG